MAYPSVRVPPLVVAVPLQEEALPGALESVHDVGIEEYPLPGSVTNKFPLITPDVAENIPVAFPDGSVARQVPLPVTEPPDT